MAKEQAVSHVEPEEDFSQDVPDEEPARVIDEDEADEAPEANGASSHNKTALIREAVQAGYEKPARGVEYIKGKYGIEIDSKYYSIVKGKLGKAGEKPTETPATASPARKPAAVAPASGGATPASLFDDLKQLRDLKDRYGDDFQKMVEAIG